MLGLPPILTFASEPKPYSPGLPKHPPADARWSSGGALAAQFVRDGVPLGGVPDVRLVRRGVPPALGLQTNVSRKRGRINDVEA